MDTRAIEKQLNSVRWCSPVENIPPRLFALAGHKETGTPLFLVSHMLDLVRNMATGQHLAFHSQASWGQVSPPP